MYRSIDYATGWMLRGFSNSRGGVFSFLWGLSSILFSRYRDSFTGGKSGHGVKLTTQLHLAQRVIMCGALLPLCVGTNSLTFIFNFRMCNGSHNFYYIHILLRFCSNPCFYVVRGVNMYFTFCAKKLLLFVCNPPYSRCLLTGGTNPLFPTFVFLCNLVVEIS
jgi:hypothetical protein